MSEPSNPLRLEVVGVLRNGRRRYDPVSKRRLVEACLQPGVSLASVAMQRIHPRRTAWPQPYLGDRLGAMTQNWIRQRS